MAAELATMKLNPENHLLLDQPLLKVPYELARKNFKAAQRLVEHERDALLSTLKSTAKNAVDEQSSLFPPLQPSSPSHWPPSQSPALDAIDSMISRMEGLKRKLEGLHDEEKTLHKHSRKRIEHLQDLHEIKTVADVKFDKWSEVRLNRLLVDYLLRCGYGESAKALAKDRGIEELVDIDAFMQCFQIGMALEKKRVQECLAWCDVNGKALKKMDSDLEFELRMQQYIELVRTRKLVDARDHAKKYLLSHLDQQHAIQAAGLLAFPPHTQIEPYKTMYSADRWRHLATLFVHTHHDLLSLPARPALYIALSAGLSALKTPSCHSSYTASSASASGTSVCPICSTELNELARDVPYAHHAKSHVENDPVVLPNGRIYGRERLMKLNEKIVPPEGKVRDPTDTTVLFDVKDIKKVYIS